MNVLLALVSCAAPQLPAHGPTEEIATLHLRLTFPADFAELEASTELEDHEKAVWYGGLGSKSIGIWLQDWSEDEWLEPMDLIESLADSERDEAEDGDPNFAFDEQRLVSGPFGWVPYAAFARCSTDAQDPADGTQEDFYLAGVVDGGAYVIYVGVVPAPSDAERKIVIDFLTRGIAYTGAVCEPKWTEAEAEARWKESVPDSDEKSRQLEPPLRTEHFLILTNSSGGKLFSKKMEENYATIRRAFPFEEVAGQRLLPVFLFRTPDEYYEFYAQTFESTREEAEKSKGVAEDDFYATWYEAPNDPVHLHEATHQIFGNRLYLNGAGSWFQEGVAEYVETKKNDRNDIARRVVDGEHTPLVELLRIESLLWNEDDAKADKTGRDRASENYELAALLIEFLCESKFGREKFQSWIHAIGRLGPNDVTAIERVTRGIYGVDLASLERELVAHCKKR